MILQPTFACRFRSCLHLAEFLADPFLLFSKEFVACCTHHNLFLRPFLCRNQTNSTSSARIRTSAAWIFRRRMTSRPCWPATKIRFFIENWNQVIWNSFQSNAIRSEKNGHKEPSWPTQNLFYSDDVTGRWSDGANRMIFLASIRPQVCAGGKGFSRRSFEIPADIVLPIDGFFPLEQHRDLQFFWEEKHPSNWLICRSSDDFPEVQILWAELIRSGDSSCWESVSVNLRLNAPLDLLALEIETVQFLEIHRMEFSSCWRLLKFRLRGRDWPRDPMSSQCACAARPPSGDTWGAQEVEDETSSTCGVSREPNSAPTCATHLCRIRCGVWTLVNVHRAACSFWRKLCSNLATAALISC